MKRISIASILLINLGLLSTALIAQESAVRHYPRYRLVDLGTFGGINSLKDRAVADRLV